MTQGRQPRYALYFTPSPSSPLARFGAQVIGYDPESGKDVPHLELSAVSREELIAATQAPRGYGFHATLVAPFYLNGGSEDRLREGVEEFCRRTVSVVLGKLDMSVLAGFIALTPSGHCPAVGDLAARCVECFDRFRAPLGADDLARRNRGGLSFRQRQYLDRWGYPYVFEEFRFHLTLTGALATADRQRFHAALKDAYRPIAEDVHDLDAVSLLRQSDADSRFEVVARLSLRPRS